MKVSKCCSTCDGGPIQPGGRDRCNNPTEPDANGNCPLKKLGETCQSNEQCNSMNSEHCSNGVGDSCVPGNSTCTSPSNRPDGLICSTTERKCLYPLRHKCYELDPAGCDRQDGLNPNTTIKCVNDPFPQQSDTLLFKCLPILPPGSQCLSENDCIKGPCKEGLCLEGVIPEGGTCNPNADRCIQGSKCEDANSDTPIEPIENTAICKHSPSSSCKPGETECAERAALSL